MRFSLWDVARRMVEYHVHRLPVMEVALEGEPMSETDILFMVTLKDIFSECLIKQVILLKLSVQLICIQARFFLLL